VNFPITTHGRMHTLAVDRKRLIDYFRSVREDEGMDLGRYRRWMSWRGALLIAAALVAAIVVYRHRPIPRSEFVESLPGIYAIRGNSDFGLEFPTAVRGKTLTIRDMSNGKIKATSDGGSTLEFSRRADKVTFRETFSPVGPVIPLGIAQFWNEGQLTKIDGKLVVNGYRVEKGVSIFGSFKKVNEWRVDLIRIADAPPEQKPHDLIDRH
jgi:hypothetical protein